ncbi:Uncharacterised protein [Klebsiella grimontii]|nr:Uncharacterised protein [Klebsiella grimontii]
MFLMSRVIKRFTQKSIKSWPQVCSHAKSEIFLRLSVGLLLIMMVVLSGSRMKIQSLENWLSFTHGGAALFKTVFQLKISMLT